MVLLEGKWVLVLVKDIQEVRNVICVYELMFGWYVVNISDFLMVYKMLMIGLVDCSGVLCGGNVGIYCGMQVIYMVLFVVQVLRLIVDLFSWLEYIELYFLIVSLVFYYEFEFIYFFVDGNGWMGCLWQMLILSQWCQELVWLLVEMLIYYQ